MSEIYRRRPVLDSALSNNTVGMRQDKRSKGTLIEYLQHAITLESAIATQQAVINEYNSETEKRKPQLLLEQFGPKPEYIHGVGLDIVLCIIFIFPFIGAGFLGIIAGSMDESTLYILIGIAFFGMGAHMFYKLYDNISVMIKSFKSNLEYNKKMNIYYEECSRISKQNDLIKNEYECEIKQWAKDKKEINDEMNQKLLETQQAINALYSLDIIYPKYRNLPALTSIYEYLVTGRCEELTGPYGAYNLYEDEIRKDTVISQLSSVIENLEKVRQNQYLLYEQVCNIRRDTYQITRELREIKGYTVALTKLTALNTYYAGITASNSSAMAYYYYLR